MPWMFLNKETLPAFIKRFEAIKPEDKPRWGTLTPPGMLRHLRYMADLSLGEVSEPDKSNIFFRTVVKFLFFHVFTNWPKGKFKAPDSLTPPAEGDLERERQALIEKLRRFAELAASEPSRMVAHPIFGPTRLDYWTRLHGVHFEHHLKQYGV